MGLGEQLKSLPQKLGATVRKDIHEISNVNPDSTSAPGANRPPDPVSSAEADAAAAGFPPDVR
jgi:hypothetical protein